MGWFFDRDDTRNGVPTPASPFFKPSTPRVFRPISTPGGTTKYIKKEVDKEHKASILGTAGNLINAIVGAGIVGIAYAVREAGLVAGVFMIIFCAILTEKSLRLLIETAKHVDVPSYERLCEASFGRAGFFVISAAMFIMSYGAMISYLMVVKDVLPLILGFEADDIPMKRAILTVSSLTIMLPLSCQRDMADLAKTSTLSVIFDIIMVIIVVIFSPTTVAIENSGGLANIISKSTIYPRTFFIGLGVLSFAFVCQHSAFIIAGSLHKPTKKRWGQVTRTALIVCGSLATLIGTFGYVAFQDATTGNILNNFEDIHDNPVVLKAANIARALLCTTMFFVYPLESFVSRHVTIVTIFEGRRAHEGDDHAVLARWDRRIGLTFFLYLMALVPALLFEEVGVVLSATGAVGGSTLSYIGPGCVYLGVHGEEFLNLVKANFGSSGDNNGDDARGDDRLLLRRIFGNVSYYGLLFPIWCSIASTGYKMTKSFAEEEACKSPHPNRLGKIVHHKPCQVNRYVELQQSMNKNKYVIPPKITTRDAELGDDDDFKPLLIRASSFNTDPSKIIKPPPYYGTAATSAGGVGATDRAIAMAIASQNQKQGKKTMGTTTSSGSDEESEEEDDPQEEMPSWYDFVIAIFYIIFGTIALCAGIVSIFIE